MWRFFSKCLLDRDTRALYHSTITLLKILRNMNGPKTEKLCDSRAVEKDKKNYGRLVIINEFAY